MKVVINKCYGGFGLSNKAMFCYAKHKGIKLHAYKMEDRNVKDCNLIEVDENYNEKSIYGLTYTTDVASKLSEIKSRFTYHRDIERNDPDLIATVEELGEDANGECAELKIVEIPDGTNYVIDNYDGMERVEEAHESWAKENEND